MQAIKPYTLPQNQFDVINSSQIPPASVIVTICNMKKLKISPFRVEPTVFSGPRVPVS